MSDWPSYETAPRAAFVDVDGTLLAETSTYLFARLMRRRGLIRRSFVVRAAYHGLQHKLGKLNYAGLVAFGLRNIAHIPVSELEAMSAENFRDSVKPRLYLGVVEHFEELRAAGTQILLVSSSPEIVIKPLADYLGCVGTLTTPVVYRDGRLVGLQDGPACYGEGKLYWATQWAEQNGVALADCAAYADNWSDRALLSSVGRAVAVNPHRMLRRLAIERGWTVVEARSPTRPRPRPRARPRRATGA
jgi:HAD superfamily hydrolase (TIGR01490 family)